GGEHQGDYQGLVEDLVGLFLVPMTHRLRDEGYRADAEDLGEGHDDKEQGATGPHAGDRIVAQCRDEVEIHQQVESLEDHAGGNRCCHGDDGAGDGALREVFHASQFLKV